MLGPDTAFFEVSAKSPDTDGVKRVFREARHSTVGHDQVQSPLLATLESSSIMALCHTATARGGFLRLALFCVSEKFCVSEILR